jgi:hypothetical protein
MTSAHDETMIPTCRLRWLNTSEREGFRNLPRLQQWCQTVEEAGDFMTRAIIEGKVPEPRGEWRDVEVAS